MPISGFQVIRHRAQDAASMVFMMIMCAQDTSWDFILQHAHIHSHNAIFASLLWAIWHLGIWHLWYLFAFVCLSLIFVGQFLVLIG